MRLSFLLLLSLLVLHAAEDDALADAVAALQRGDLGSAEQTLRSHLRTRPNDPAALDVLGVVLDQEQKYADADDVYRRATALDPRSPGLLNNYGNHLLVSGKLKEARAVFLKVLALNPAQTNAAVQLARIALEQKAPAEAMRRLDALPSATKDAPNVAILIMRASYALGHNSEGDAILQRLASAPQSDTFQLAVALASVGHYEKSEALFSRALEASPGNFEILHNLGLAASHAGHNQRALEVLQSALTQQPQNVDVLYDLAAVNAALEHNDEALRLLAQAARLAPDRPDVLRLLARTTAELGYFNDAIQAWDRYLKLVPGDDFARRERAFAQTGVGDNMKAGLAELRSFVIKHPNDAVGHYELGVALSATDAAQAVAQFNKALAIKPDLTAVHLARGLLNYRQGDPAAALADFEFAARREPEKAVVLDRLGQTYMALDRSADAVPFLRKAAELAPRDSKILMHLGRALSNTGQAEEAKAVFQRFRELGPDKTTLARPAGLVDFLSLAPEQQMARYRAGVERTVRANPNNVEAQVRWLELLLGDGKMEDAAAVSRQILALKPGAALLAEAAAALLATEQYALAKELLESQAASSPELQLDRAIATFHVVNAPAGLQQLDRIPDAQRSGDYYLARADMLGAMGRLDDASAALERAVRASPKRPDLYRRAALLLINNQRAPQALQLLDRGTALLPDNAQVLLLKAAALALCSKSLDAERLLKTIEDRWPELPTSWALHGLILGQRGEQKRAREMFETAAQLAPGNPAIDALAGGNTNRPLNAADVELLFR